MFEDWIDMEVVGSPKFLISLVMGGAVLAYVLTSWSGRVQGLTGYAIVGAVVLIGFAYYWAGRDIDQNG